MCLCHGLQDWFVSRSVYVSDFPNLSVYVCVLMRMRKNDIKRDKVGGGPFLSVQFLHCLFSLFHFILLLF